ncbi:hypothetical protein ACWD7M_16145 [Streptomyces griseus]
MPPRAWLLAVGALVAGLFAGFSLASESVPPAPLPDNTAGQAKGSEPEQPTDTTIPGQGTFWVGADVESGLYHSAKNSTACSWRRLKDASGEPESVLADEKSAGDAYVHIEDGEFFASTQCNTWKRVTQNS